MNTKYKILKDIFGHDTFRSFQEEVVDTILNKQDLLTILPTGGGKSLCYQLPTLLMEGTTVVISPLIALMQDQIKALKELNIKADMISSATSFDENSWTLQKLLKGELQFIYVAPERLTSNEFIAVLQRISINYFVIDEAHCVSAWGHEFRAEYRNLDKLKRFFPHTAICAFTATATKKVEEDIVQSLNLDHPKHFRAKTVRDNLDIVCEPRIANGKTQILKFLQTHKGLCGIIYTFTRKEAESTAEFLHQQGYSAKAYHAGLSNDRKNEVFNDFVYEKIDIVVATIAFGMGIDKSNIRFVIHTSLPKTLENYYQEIGRAGRDGEMSYVYLLYAKSDEIKRKIQIEEAIDSTYKPTALQKLEQMYSYCISGNCRHKMIAAYFDDEINECNTLCDNCTQGEIELLDITTDAQKFLSAVYRSHQMYGINHIIDILRASKNQKILDAEHENLSVYGIGLEWSKNEWSVIANKLVDIEALHFAEFRVVKLSTLGFDILKGNQKVFIEAKRLKDDTLSQSIEEVLSPQEEIFERFKALRKAIALSHEVPAYVIFGDKSLKEIATKLPLTKEAMLEVNGVGEVKFEKYGEAFLALCHVIKEEYATVIEERPLRKLTKTYLDTYELLKEAKSIEDIALIRDLGVTTILSHVQLLFEHGKITQHQKEELLKPLEIPLTIKSWIEEGLKMENLKELRQYLSLYEHLYLYK